MPTQHIRNVDDDLAQSLRELAASNSLSMEPEVCALLADAFARRRRRSLVEVLATRPIPGKESDFERAGRYAGDRVPRRPD